MTGSGRRIITTHKKKTSLLAPTPDASMPKPPVEWLAQVMEWLRWVWHRLGWKGVLVIGPVIAGLIVWWNWKEISERPGIQTVVELLTRESLPQADPRKFSIAITHLNDDSGHAIENLVYEALNEISGGSIQILRFDRLIAIEGSDSDSISRKWA
jgi:hypothetical protein